MNNIKITLLSNKKFEVENLDDIDILEDEDNATNIEIQFPEEYSEHSKRIDFMNIRGEKWSTSLYAPEEPTNEYAEGFDTLNFMFSIPNAMAKRGELQIQPIAYIPGQSVVPFRILVAKIDKSIIYATTPGKETPDLVIKAYEHSNKALSTANEAFAKIEHSEELVEIATQNSTNSTNKANEAQASALAAENSAKSAQNSATTSQKSAESSQLSATNAENSANAAKESAKTAENLASTANNKSTTAVNTANESNEKSTKALEIVDNLTVTSEEIDCEETTKVEIQTNSSTKRKNIHFSVPAPKKGTSYRNKGVWSSTNNYVNDQYFIDTVSLHGCTYYCKVSNANQQPLPSEENQYWGLIAIKGSDAGVTIEDNLNSTNADHVLSAKQGSIIKNQQNQQDLEISNLKTNKTTVSNSSGGFSCGTGATNTKDMTFREFTLCDSNGKIPVARIFDAIYPIGSIYMSVSSTNPQTLFGGTWVAWGSGRVPIGIGSNGETNYTTAEQTGGSENSVASHNHTQNSHNHTQNSHNHTQNSHRHKFNRGVQNEWSGNVVSGYGSASRYLGWVEQGNGGGDSYQYTTGKGTSPADYETATNNATTATNNSTTATNNATGTSGGNRQPFITCYMWKRTA